MIWGVFSYLYELKIVRCLVYTVNCTFCKSLSLTIICIITNVVNIQSLFLFFIVDYWLYWWAYDKKMGGKYLFLNRF